MSVLIRVMDSFGKLDDVVEDKIKSSVIKYKHGFEINTQFVN